MKNSISIKVLFVALLAMLVIAGCGKEEKGSTTSEEKIKFKIADSFPTTNYLSLEGTKYFMDKVVELTDGKVEFEYYPAEQIGKANSYLDLTLSNTIQIGYTSYAADRLPLSEIATLPGAYDSSEEGSNVIWKLMKDYLMDEEYLPNGVRPLYAVALPQYQLATVKKPVTKIEDIKGMKTRVTGTMELGFDELGSSPVFMPATEAYTAMERGTVDGVTFPFTSFTPYQIEEIANYSTKGANLGSFTVIYSINEKIYQDLPEDVKDALAEAGDETVKHLSVYLDDKNEELAEEFSSKMEIYELTEEESAEWDGKLKPVWDRWAKNLEKRGINANEAIEKYQQIRKELKE